MRAPESEPTGTAGTSEVAAEFQRLGWGATENARHDLGTDLFLQARDERRFDLGLMLGVQVKAGPWYFREPKHGESGEIEGWWFRDEAGKHIDAWLAHVLPHLIVLRDMDERTSHWVHVTQEAVKPAGKGAKILVPRSQIVSPTQRAALLDVAKSQRPSVPWEGSVWAAGEALRPHQLLRHALLVPRLVAPHPNAGVDGGLTPEQGAALLMVDRYRMLDRYAREHDAVPTIAEAAQSDDWRWRFVSALDGRLVSGTVGALVAAVDDAPSAWTRAAATVAAAAAKIELGEAEEAVPLLDATLQHDDADPVDQAWLQMQRARARAEIGELRASRADALSVVGIRSAYPDDAPATALSGTAWDLLLSTSDWNPDDFKQAVIGNDTAANWWRLQVSAHGLGAIVDRTFKAWARFGASSSSSNEANNSLFSASVLASHLGTQAGWRHHAGLTGANLLLELDRHAEPETAGRALEDLRLAGATDQLTAAVARLTLDGPAYAVRYALERVDLARSTRTTWRVDLALAHKGGFLADGAAAERIARQLLEILQDPSAFATRTSPAHGFVVELVQALAGITPATNTDQQTAIRDHVLAVEALADEILGEAYGLVVGALQAAVWDGDACRRAFERSAGHRDTLALPLLAAAAPGDERAAARLQELAAKGSYEAVTALGGVDALSSEIATAFTDRLATQVRDAVKQARTGLNALGLDVGSWLVVFNVFHPGSAQWQPVVEFLAEPAVLSRMKVQSLRKLAMLVNQVPEAVRTQLVPVACSLAERDRDRDPFLSGPDETPGAAANLLDALTPGGAGAERIAALLCGDWNDRKWAACCAARRTDPESNGLLVVLTSDADPRVRAKAAAALAARVGTDSLSDLAARAVESCVDDPGVRVPTDLAVALQEAGTANGLSMLESLRDHPSAYIRAFVRRNAPKPAR